MFIFTIVSLYNIYNKDQVIVLYEKLIDLTINEDLIEDYLSIDFNNITYLKNRQKLSENTKKEILNYCKKYSNNVYSKTKEALLKSPNYSNDNELYGLSLTIHVNKISNKIYNISLIYYKGLHSSSMITYSIEYINNNFNIKKIQNITS